jgi:hypothetical protein
MKLLFTLVNSVVHIFFATELNRDLKSLTKR